MHTKVHDFIEITTMAKLLRLGKDYCSDIIIIHLQMEVQALMIVLSAQ